ncbi:dihydrofolate reductase family protein [Nocardia sp. 2]|uniref:Dihydrofolate reductase family protein n=1 Tax=Nocardia acididurans TaxID=2802282 RepID=A0ABS1M1R8_9NOCA|nr:dihydrofolate reductase family protein [Nocardia acididurans]MBL1074446.1 dihydrofolate reductase family protein [Nocardia acididurans]
MSRLVVSTFVSLDGVMQGPGGPGEDDSDDFAHGGWLVPFADEAMGAIIGEVFATADAMLLGRKSYDILSGHWPHVEGEEGAQINGMRKYVASRSLETADWNNTVVLKGEAAQTIAELKASTEGEILVQGSSDLIGTLQRAGLIDEYRLLIFPVVLGAGKRLFTPGTVAAGLKLTRTSTTPAGIVYAVYETTPGLGYGTLALDAEAGAAV